MASISDLTADQHAALSRFSGQHPSNWKFKLLGLWASGKDERQRDGALLRQIRNQHGPQWLRSLKDKP